MRQLDFNLHSIIPAFIHGPQRIVMGPRSSCRLMHFFVKYHATLACPPTSLFFGQYFQYRRTYETTILPACGYNHIDAPHKRRG